MSQKAIHTLSQLQESELIEHVTPELQKVAEQFSVSITPTMIDLIRDNKNGPIAAQFLPNKNELNISPYERFDPIGDAKHSPIEGVVHRYPDRVLLKLVGVCPVYCRFCFRRESVANNGHNLTDTQISAALDYIRQHQEIWEVILSGGDPLILSDRHLDQVMQQLQSIEHVKVIRIHTRVPVVQPERITQNLLAILKTQKPVYILLHCNHATELTAAARKACAMLIDAGVPMLSQSVLLRGINDHPATLEQLMRAFVENRIKPHYLHHTDLAHGTSHFRVSLEEAHNLLRALRGKISGLCQPSYILDIPDGHGKVPIGPAYIAKHENYWLVEDISGHHHEYKDTVKQHYSEQAKNGLCHRPL